MQRGPIGRYRRALTTALPGWALCSISFVGRQIGELLVHKSLADRAIATMKALGFRHLHQLDPVMDPRFKDRGLTTEENILRNVHACHYRFQQAASTPIPSARKWYLNAAARLTARFPALFTEVQAAQYQELRQRLLKAREARLQPPVSDASSEGSEYDPPSHSSDSTTDLATVDEEGFTTVTRKRKTPTSPSSTPTPATTPPSQLHARDTEGDTEKATLPPTSTPATARPGTTPTSPEI
ncbi:hypothetical protein BWQ96_00951 [Gracilariopsis chorda]|uniref:Uncharacterized protein n=1 Tax=Gracilariopsis chorda TaxID=448386 RepID=A0A2V3J4W2_9FLOR|nr:hypothetical protein BWQ96_00951 [Gracilariopsis chorda]|eukprot:PXF49162.1 hypothetical protein BWQ96_00951 [Gracilariopsis chorda]